MFSSPAGEVKALLSAQASATTGSVATAPAFGKAIEATVRHNTTGAVSATIEIYGNTRNDNTDGILLATITLSGTTVARDGFAFDAPWPFIYAKLNAISATSTVDVDLAV
jgi:hypothetical protein